jgi:hypothetical protein
MGAATNPTKKPVTLGVQNLLASSLMLAHDSSSASVIAHEGRFLGSVVGRFG